MIKLRIMRWVEFVALMGKNKNAYKTLGGRPERTSLERAKDRFRRIIDNIRMKFKDLVCESVDWIHLIQDRVQ